jgi:hypothetical protein
VGLIASEDSIILKAFRLIPKDNYAYIAIHGDNTGFNVFEDNVLKPMTNLSLAKWIADNRVYDGRTIVLLSCNDSISTQKLTNALATLDVAAKRATRKIIAWDGEMVVYDNGYLLGNGKCKQFQACSTATCNTTILTGAAVPKGIGTTPSVNRVVLSSDPVSALRSTGFSLLADKIVKANWDNASKSQFIKDFSGNIDALQLINNISYLDAWKLFNDLNLKRNFLTHITPIEDPTVKLFDFLDSYLLLRNNSLFQNMGNATIAHMTILNRYTRNGNYLLWAMRGNSYPAPEDVLLTNAIVWDATNPIEAAYRKASYEATVEALVRLRTTTRLQRDVMVFRGRNYTLNQYKQLFHSTAPIEIPLKGFQSCSKTTDTPFEFFGKSRAVPTGTLITDADYVKLVTDFDNYIVGKDLTNSLVDVMLKIKSKNGIDIDDISDWGNKMGVLRHPGLPRAQQIQQEVLLEEGKFKRIGVVVKSKTDGKPYIEVTLEELGIPLVGR